MPYQSLQLSRRTSYPNTPSHYDFVPSQLCFMPTYSKIEEDAKLCFRINFVDDTNLSIYCVTWEHNILQCALFWAEPWELQPYLGTKPVHRISKSQTTWREIFQIFVLWCLVFGKLKKNHRDVIFCFVHIKTGAFHLFRYISCRGSEWITFSKISASTWTSAHGHSGKCSFVNRLLSPIRCSQRSLLMYVARR